MSGTTIVETPNNFPADVYRLERDDAGDAGTNQDGPLNLPLVDLANRSAFLKAAVDAVISGENGVPDNVTPGLLYVAIQTAINNAIAAADGLLVGAILPCPASTPLPGTLGLDGSLISRVTYADLWAYANASGNITNEAAWAATNWGGFSDGDLATTFRLPDLRGEFLRGWDNGRGIDAARVLGAWQAEEVGPHMHSTTVRRQNNTGGAFEGISGSQASSNTYLRYTNNGSGTNNRPRNLAAMFCIKY